MMVPCKKGAAGSIRRPGKPYDGRIRRSAALLADVEPESRASETIGTVRAISAAEN